MTSISAVVLRRCLIEAYADNPLDSADGESYDRREDPTAMEASLCVHFTTADWKRLEQRLDANDPDAWDQAIAVFERRLHERYLRCIDALICADTKPDLRPNAEGPECTPGFAIMALCCLLMETLQAFREPAPNQTPPSGPCNFPQGACIKPSSGTAQQFREFLKRPSFRGAFSNESLASSFVNGIRNGILHDAETRRWLIWRDSPKGELVGEVENGFVLNRTEFYDAVKAEFHRYVAELRDTANADLRARFRKKMHRLCRDS